MDLNKVVYLDNAATTFPKPDIVVQNLVRNISQYGASPSRGLNKEVIKSNKLVYEVRNIFAHLLGTVSENISFVPSATYGLNYALFGVQKAAKKKLTVYSSPFEHNAVTRCLHKMKEDNLIRWLTLPIDQNMVLDEDKLKEMYTKLVPDVVVTTHASNVTGDFLPVCKLTEISKEYNALIILDASQTAGIWFNEIKEIPWNICVFSSHKSLYGIVGSGVLALRDDDLNIEPVIYGGTGSDSDKFQMPSSGSDRFEPGTKNLLAIRSMYDGFNWISSIGFDKIKKHNNYLRDLLLSYLKEFDNVRVYNANNSDNTGVVSFNVIDYKPQEVSTILSSNNICVRSGLQCSPLAHQRLETYPNGTTRVSFSYFNTATEIEYLYSILKQIAK